MTGLDGKVALITEAGATVVGCDITPVDGSDPVDLTDEDAVRPGLPSPSPRQD